MTRFFCIGAAKTGTTILARLLDQQRDVACMWEAYFFLPNHPASVFNPDGGGWRRHGLERSDVERWRADALAVFARPAGESGDHGWRIRETRRLISEVLDTFGSSMLATVVGDKWPFYARRLDLMLEAFPDAVFVYNVRDPRAVWNSGQTFRNRGRGDEILADMLATDRAVRERAAGHRFVTIRYEDLVDTPAVTMRDLATALGFDFDESRLAYRRDADPLPQRWQWIDDASRDLDRALSSRWAGAMTSDEVARVEATAPEFMQCYGYLPHEVIAG